MTIKEVAQMAGVSPAAVSRYFNGGSLSTDKQERIRKVVEETGFRPNPLAKTMRTGRSGQIGVIAPKIDSDFVPAVLEGISGVVRRENYIMILGFTYHDESQELRLLDALQENKVEGILLMGRALSPVLAQAVGKCRVPVVVTEYGGGAAGEPAAAPHPDGNPYYEECGRKAAETLVTRIREGR